MKVLAMKSLKHFDAEFAVTNRLRTEGTDNLLAAARASGVRRIVAQSYGNWNYERTGTTLKTEEDRFDPDPPAKQLAPRTVLPPPAEGFAPPHWTSRAVRCR